MAATATKPMDSDRSGARRPRRMSGRDQANEDPVGGGRAVARLEGDDLARRRGHGPRAPGRIVLVGDMADPADPIAMDLTGLVGVPGGQSDLQRARVVAVVDRGEYTPGMAQQIEVVLSDATPVLDPIRDETAVAAPVGDAAAEPEGWDPEVVDALVGRSRLLDDDLGLGRGGPRAWEPAW